MSIKTRLLQLERRHALMYPPQSEMTNEEMLVAIRRLFEAGHLKFEGMRVVSTVAHTDELGFSICAKLAGILTERAEQRPHVALSLLLPDEAEALVEMLEADQLALNPVRELDGSVKHCYLWPKPSCEHNGAEQLVRHCDLALDAWAEQSGEERPQTLEAIIEWARTLVGDLRGRTAS